MMARVCHCLSFALCWAVPVLELPFPGLYQPGFTAKVATLEPAITHISSIDCKVNDGMDYTRPDKYGIEGGKWVGAAL